jgi:XTP/dITP diphosphohydrolase
MKLFFASGNPHKAEEFQSLADAAGEAVRIFPATAVGGMPTVAEDAGTFAGNARQKALALRERLPAAAWVLADDSGLCVEALGGAPGVESAYFAGRPADDGANLEKLMAEMRDVPEARRGAYFTCVLVVAGPDGEFVFEGQCAGRLLSEPRGIDGFGYDPLFMPDGYGQTFSELGAEIKNRLSHRARAWEKLVNWHRELPRVK